MTNATPAHAQAARANDEAALRHDEAQAAMGLGDRRREAIAHHATDRALALTRATLPILARDVSETDIEIDTMANEAEANAHSRNHPGAAHTHRRLAVAHREAARTGNPACLLCAGAGCWSCDPGGRPLPGTETDIARWQAAEAESSPAEGYAEAAREATISCDRCGKTITESQIELSADGLETICEECKKIDEPAWTQEEQEAHIGGSVPEKTCPICLWEASLSPEQVDARARAIDGGTTVQLLDEVVRLIDAEAEDALRASLEQTGDLLPIGPEWDPTREAIAEALAMLDDSDEEDEINPFNKEAK